MEINCTQYNILKTHFRCLPANYLDVIKLSPLYDLNWTNWIDPWYLQIELSCQTRGLLRGRISTIYAILTDPGTKLPYMNQWERDLNTTLELSDWQDIAYALSKISINTTLIEANYKTLLRWYLVPTRVAKMHPSALPACFRCCGQMGTMFHVWWQCPVVARFWIRIFNLVYSVTGVNIRRSPEPALFHKLPDEVPKKIDKINSIYFSGS